MQSQSGSARRCAAVFSVLAAGAVLAGSAIRPSTAAGATKKQLKGVIVYAITASNQLISFDAAKPGKILSTDPIGPLRDGETLLGIDTRTNGSLYVLGRAEGSTRIYSLTTTGATTPIGEVSVDPALTGAQFGIDFNPTVDRIRVVADDEQNLRLNPIDGSTSGTDTTLAYAAGDSGAGSNPAITAAAYSNPDTISQTGTTLYGIDSDRDVLVLQGSRERSNPTVSPNTGELRTVGSLGTNVTGVNGFDIIGDDYTGNSQYAALAAFQKNGGGNTSTLYSIDLFTGRAKSVGKIGGKELVTGLAIALPVPPQ